MTEHDFWDRAPRIITQSSLDLLKAGDHIAATVQTIISL